MYFDQKVRKVLFAATLSLILFSCSSKKNDNPTANGGNPNVSVDALQIDNCLSLEKLVSHFNQESFNFPGRKITTDLSTSIRSDQFFIYNFGISNTRIRALPFIRNAKQTNCSSVAIENAYGRQLHYRIEHFTKDSLSLVRDRSSDPIEPIKVKSDAQKNEPELRAIKITVESPTSILMALTANTVFPRCSSTRLFDYSKTLRVRWAESESLLPPVEVMDPNLVARARRFSAPPAPAPVLEPPAAFLFSPRIAHAEESSEEVAIDELPIEEPPSDVPPTEDPPVVEAPIEDPAPVDDPVVEESPETAPPTTPPVVAPPEGPIVEAPPSAPTPTTVIDQFNVQEILELQRSIRQVAVSRSCSN